VRPDIFLIPGAASQCCRSHEAAVFDHLARALDYRDAGRSYRRMAAEESAYEARQAARAAAWADTMPAPAMESAS
jgi:hypothetical protein